MCSLLLWYRSIRMLSFMVAKFDLKLKQMDMNTAFMYGDLDETIQMKQTEWYEENDKDDYGW